MLSAEQTRDVREKCTALTYELAGTVPPNTLVALRGGFLLDRGLLDETRRDVLTALTKELPKNMMSRPYISCWAVFTCKQDCRIKWMRPIERQDF